MKLENFLMLTPDERALLEHAALSHDGDTVCTLKEGSLLSTVLRLLDFECLSKYSENHNIPWELANRVLTATHDARFGELVPDCEVPAFLMFFGLYHPKPPEE